MNELYSDRAFCMINSIYDYFQTKEKKNQKLRPGND